MSEAVQIALITVIANAVMLVLSRAMSHYEHKSTSVKLNDFMTKSNGGLDIALQEAYARGVSDEKSNPTK